MMGWYYECILHFTELVDTTYKGRGELFSLHMTEKLENKLVSSLVIRSVIHTMSGTFDIWFQRICIVAY